MTLKYQSGEEILRGDRVLFHGQPAEIGLVASAPSEDPEAQWYIQEHGGGVLVLDPNVSGRTFIPADTIEEHEDLEFVSRAGAR